MDLNVDEIKQKCKKRNCTINDYCFSLISVSMHRYMKSKSDQETPKFIQMLMPISLRESQSNIEDFKINNQVVGMPL